jgi:hypothetical protein
MVQLVVHGYSVPKFIKNWKIAKCLGFGVPSPYVDGTWYVKSGKDYQSLVSRNK